MLDKARLPRNEITFRIPFMEIMKVQVDDMLMASVPVEEDPAHPLAREAYWQQHATEVRASVSNDTLNLQILCNAQSVLVFAGKVSAPVTFACQIADSKRLTLSFQ